MSSKQDLIEIKEVISQCNQLIKEQSEGWAKIVSEIKKVNSSAPSSYIKMQKEVADSIKKIDELETKYQVTVQKGQTLQTKVNDERLKEIELQKKREKAIDDFNKKEQQSEAKRVQNILNTGKALSDQKNKEIALQQRTELATQKATQKALEQSRAYNVLQTNWRNAQRTYADLLSTVNASPQAIAKARNEFELLDKKIKQVDTTTKNYSKNVGNYSSAMKGVSSLVGGLAGALGIIGAIDVAVKLVSNAFDSIVKFDAGLLNVAKTTGLAGKELKNLGTDIRALSSELEVVSAVKLTEYATVAGQLGVKGSADILKFTKALAMLETASDITGQQGGAEIARLLTLVDGGVQNVDKFGDEIVKLGNNFAATESEILTNSTAIAQNTGVYKLGRQTVLAYGVATKAVGIEAEITGSTIGRVLAEIEKSIRTGENIDTLAKLTRKSVSELKNEFKTDPSGVLYSFIEGLNAVDKSGGSVLGTLDNLGITAVRDKRVIASLATGGYDVLTKALTDVSSASGSMQEEFDTASTKIENSINRVKVSWENLILDINGSENTIGSLASKWLIGLSIIIDKIREATTSVRELRRQSGDKIEQQVFTDTRESYSSYNTSKDTRDLASNQFKQLKNEEKSILDDIAKNRKVIEDWNKEKLIPNFLYFGLDKSKDANANIDKLTKDLAVIQGTMKGINSLSEDYNSLKNKTKTDIIVTDTDTSSSSKNKGKSAETLEKERIRRLVDIAKQEQATAEASIKRQIAEADASIKIEESYLLQQNLAVKKYESGIKIADIELKNEEQRNDRKKQLASELATDLIEIDDKYLKNKKDLNDKDFDAELKRLEEIRKTKKEEYGLLDLEYQIYFEKTKQTTFKNIKQELKYNEDLYNVKKQELDDWFEYQLDVTDEGSNERLKAEKEYQLKSIQLEKEKNNKVKALQDNFKKVMKDTALNMLGSLGGESLSQFFNGEFDKIWEGADTLGKKMQAVMKAIGDISADVLGQINAMQQANFEAQLSRLDQEKEVALKFAGDSATGREAIEKQYDAKRKEIQKKQAIAEKKMALLQIAINTAVGITAALPNIPLSIAVGVLGAVQAGIVASTPIPEFWTGTDNAPEGLALTQERGAEMITDKNGRIKTLGNSKGSQLTYLNKGDKVYNASDTTDKINEMLMGSGISPIVKVENNGLTEQQLRNALNDTLAQQPRQTTKFDEKGVTLFIERENSRTIKRGNNARI